MKLADLLGGPPEHIKKGPRCTASRISADDQATIAGALERGWTQQEVSDRLKQADMYLSVHVVRRHFVQRVCDCWADR